MIGELIGIAMVALAAAFERHRGQLITWVYRVDDPHMVHSGGIPAAKRKARSEGVAVYPHADGQRVSIFYMDGGRLRKKTKRYAKWEMRTS